MKHRDWLFAVIMLFAACTFAGCSDDDEPTPDTQHPTPDTQHPTPKQGAPIQITVMFAPGQLGDRGYADNVMEGVNELDKWDDKLEKDTLDVRFISPFNVEDARSSLRKWVETTVNPFYQNEYERRLLVLTEPFLVVLLTDIKDLLRPTDEVLLLKLNEDDIAQIAKQFSLGNRVHGLNISASYPTRKFCALMYKYMETASDPRTNYLNIPIFRLYEKTQYPYRDEIAETVEMEMGDATQLTPIALSSMKGAGVYSQDSTLTIVEAAFEAANVTQNSAELTGCPFVIVDLGAGNTGWDYWLLGMRYTHLTLSTLMLDAKNAFGLRRFYINRKFGKALMYWVVEWAFKSVGEMDAQVTHYDDTFIEDNLYAFE